MPSQAFWDWMQQNYPWITPEDALHGDAMTTLYKQRTGQDAGGGGAPGATPATSGDRTPAGLAAAFRQPDVTLPGAEAAKTGLRNLQMQSVGGLSTLLGQDPEARRKAIQDAIYANASGDINYSSDRLARDAKEGQNAKNFLNSSATGDYFLDPIERNRAVALEKAANDALTQSYGITNANTAAQAQILGQGFNEGTTGLQGEANVESANRAANQAATQAGMQTGLQLEENAANRAQQNTQFGQSLGQQNTQFGQSLGQQKELTTAALQNQKDIAASGALGSGLGGLAQIFSPQLRAGADALINKIGSFF